MKTSTRAEKTKQRIMIYADRIFYEKGIRKVTVEELCLGIPVSKRTFYKYFPNRDALVEALVIERLAVLGSLLIENLHSDKPVDYILKVHFNLLLDNMVPHVSTPMMVDIQLLLPDLWDRVESFRQGLVQTIQTLLLRGQKEATVNPDIDPEVVGKILQGLMLHLANPQFLLLNGLSLEQLVLNWQNIMLYGVLAPQRPK